jgi:hypothetical protein
MRKIVTAQFEIDYPDEQMQDWSNKDILDAYLAEDFDLIEDIIDVNFEVIAVNDTVESEKPDGDSTGETNGPTGLYEVPC